MRPLLFTIGVLAGLLPPVPAVAGPAPASRAAEPFTVAAVSLPAAQCFGTCPTWLAISGNIDATALPTFEQELKRHPEARLVLLHSGGGQVEAAERLGRVIRRRGLDTLVARAAVKTCFDVPGNCRPHAVQEVAVSRGMCASACVQILASGRRRGVLPGSFVGVHRYSQKRTVRTIRITRITDATGHVRETRQKAPGVPDRVYETEPDNRKDYASSARYFATMGIGGGIIDLMMETPHASIRQLLGHELEALKLVDGSDVAELLLQGEAGNALSARVVLTALAKPSRLVDMGSGTASLALGVAQTKPGERYEARGILYDAPPALSGQKLSVILWRDVTTTAAEIPNQLGAPLPAAGHVPLSRDTVCDALATMKVSLNRADPEDRSSTVMAGWLKRDSLRGADALLRSCPSPTRDVTAPVAVP